MNKRLEDVKTLFCLKNQITALYPLKEKFNIFISNYQQVFYKLITDGYVEMINDWIDEKPGSRDSFLNECEAVKRYEFAVKDASVIILEKNRNEKTIRELYVNDSFFENMKNISLHEVSFSSKEKIYMKGCKLR